MKNKLLILALCLSVGLNLGILAGIIYHRRQFPPRPFYFALSLSSAQKEKMKDLEITHRQKVEPLHQQIRSKREELVDLLRESKPATEKIEQKIAEISSLECELEKSMTEHLLEMRALLTPEQQQKLFSILSNRFCGRRGEGLPFGLGRRGPRSPEDKR